MNLCRQSSRAEGKPVGETTRRLHCSSLRPPTAPFLGFLFWWSVCTFSTVYIFPWPSSKKATLTQIFGFCPPTTCCTLWQSQPVTLWRSSHVVRETSVENLILSVQTKNFWNRKLSLLLQNRALYTLLMFCMCLTNTSAGLIRLTWTDLCLFTSQTSLDRKAI